MARLPATAALGVVLSLLVTQGSNAAIYHFVADLSGPAESPANASPGTGFADIDFDSDLHTMRVQAAFSGLLGTTMASHIHAATADAFTGTAGVATTTPSFVGFPLGVTSGSFDMTYDMTLAGSYRAGYLTLFANNTIAAEAALIAAAQEGKAYFNIHTTTFPGGEIRGFLVEGEAVPEPASLTLWALGAIGCAVGAIRRRKRA